MQRAPRYLGLDIGTQTGWALAEGDTIIGSGVRDLSVKASQHIGRRGFMFANFLTKIGHLDEIYYEKIQFTGARKGGGSWSGDNGELYKGLLMLLNMHAYSFGTPVIGVHPGTLKKQFTGYGAAKKHDMCQAAHMIGWKGGKLGSALQDDEADAIALIATQVKLRFGIAVKFA